MSYGILLVPVPDADGVAKWKGTLDGLAGPVRFAWLALKVLGSVVMIPIVEELAFRGFLWTRLSQTDAFGRFKEPIATFLTLVATSIVFGLVHHAMLAGVATGFVYGALMLGRPRLADAIYAHVVTNALVAVWVLVFGAWSLWA